jgi:hypothetical protein
MGQTSELDMQSFQSDVLKEIEHVFMEEEFDKTDRNLITSPRKARRISTKKEAEQLLAQKDIRRYLCPALQKISGDAYEIAKTIIPILIPLVITKTISIPIDTLLFAMIAILISRMGVAALCDDFDKMTKASGDKSQK